MLWSAAVRGRSSHRLIRFTLSVVVLLGALAVAVQPPNASAAGPVVVPAGLGLTPLLSVAGWPNLAVTARFSPDGRIYVAAKSGIVQMYDFPGDTTPVTTLDISQEVYNSWDRGLLGLALDPQFSVAGHSYLYVLYTYDKDPFNGGPTPRWGGSSPGDTCPNPPGETADGCIVTARISRFLVNSSGVAGAEQVLVDSNAQGGWCEQFPSHSVGSLAFGADGMLYAAAGEGANFNTADWGQWGGTQPSTANPVVPANPCHDPGPSPMAPPAAEGGSLRAQSVRSTVTDGYAPYDGAILRIDPATGQAPPDNPLVNNGVPGDNRIGDDRIVAYGLRNPYRMTIRPGTNEIWIGDVGLGSWEEVDKLTVGPGATSVPNFGWPCFEGNQPNYTYAQSPGGFALCDRLYADVMANQASTVGSKVGISPYTPPFAAYDHDNVPTGSNCISSNYDSPTHLNHGGSIIGGPFVGSSAWPTALRGALVVGDYTRQCLVALPAPSPGANPATSFTQMVPLVTGAAVVDIQTDLNGDITFIDANTSTLYRIQSNVGNLAPNAAFTATPSSGVAPLPVQFDGSSSTDPNNDTLTYSWDLDGNGLFETTGQKPTHTYSSSGNVTVSLKVTDTGGLTSTITHIIQVGNSAPVLAPVTTSATASGWAVGDTVTFSTTASDAQDAPGALSSTWSVFVEHCSGTLGCHQHPAFASGTGLSGSFVAPDHDWRSTLTLTVTVTDSGGLTDVKTVVLQPKETHLTVATQPPGLTVAGGELAGPSPVVQSVIMNATVPLSVSSPQTLGGVDYVFAGWADDANAASTRNVHPAAANVTYTAIFKPATRLFNAVAPTRVLDSRTGLGVAGGATAPVAAGQSIEVPVVGSGGVPFGAKAVLLNLTAASPEAPGYVTAYGCDAMPDASNLNENAGVDVANLALVPVSAAGTICLFTSSTTHLVADVSGWYGPVGDGYVPTDPGRVLDTRDGTGVASGVVPAGGTITLDLSASVPANASAVALNVTAVDALAAGFVTVSPCGTRPTVSNLNVPAGDTRPNLVVVALDASRTVCLYSSGGAHLLADLAGWFSPVGTGTLVTPSVRRLDTRTGIGLPQGRLAAGTSTQLDLSAVAPAGAKAVIMNVTSVGPDAAGYVTVYPCTAAPPTASNLNVPAGDVRPNVVFAELTAGAAVCLFSSATTDLLADVAAWII